jgi:hypothetical protein
VMMVEPAAGPCQGYCGPWRRSWSCPIEALRLSGALFPRRLITMIFFSSGTANQTAGILARADISPSVRDYDLGSHLTNPEESLAEDISHRS